MKAPDKIYCGDNGHGNLSYSNIKVYDSMVEYIRKDTLLEWAKFVLKCQEEERAKYDGPSYMKSSVMGRIDAYKVLIAKLNSL